MKKKIHGNSKYHKILTKRFLIQEYMNNKKSKIQIAKEIKCSIKAITNGLLTQKIPIRTQSEANYLSAKLRMKNRRSYKNLNNPMFDVHRFGKESPNFGKKYPGLNKGRKNGMFGRKAFYSKRCKYKTVYMRSSYEIKYAQFLDLSGIKWKYESKRFYFKDCSYCPDFYIPEWDLYIEIKGWWRWDSKKRFNLFKKLYPKVKIKVLMKPELVELGVLE